MACDNAKDWKRSPSEAEGTLNKQNGKPELDLNKVDK